MEENNQVDEIKEPKKIEVEKPRPKDTREGIIPEVKDNVTKKDDEE